VNDQQVDHADDIARAQSLEVGQHLAAEVEPIEADDEELDGSERRAGRLRTQPPSTLRFAIWNSSGERAPSSWSAFKALSCSTTSGFGAAEHHRSAPQRPENHARYPRWERVATTGSQAGLSPRRWPRLAALIG
jgi:hypothetical protein